MGRNKLLMIILVFFAGMSGSILADEKPGYLKLQGKSLFSFTPDHFILQSDKYFYKISKNGLSVDLVAKLEKSALNNENITVQIPNKKIDYIWPAVFSGSGAKSTAVYATTAAELAAEVTENNGRVQLKGNLILSFSEPYYLIQVNNSIYQLKKSALSNTQIKELQKINLGGRINLSVSQSAVSYTWNFKQDVSRNIASLEEPDEILTNKSYMTLKGTVLYSVNEPIVIIQSSNVVYHIKRKGIVTKNPKLLDVHGSKIQLIVPINEVEFFWTMDNTKLVTNGPK